MANRSVGRKRSTINNLFLFTGHASVFLPKNCSLEEIGDQNLSFFESEVFKIEGGELDSPNSQVFEVEDGYLYILYIREYLRQEIEICII